MKGEGETGEELLAGGFWRCNIINNQPGAEIVAVGEILVLDEVGTDGRGE